MGLIDTIFSAIFGNNRNVIRDTVEVFRPNAEQDAQRGFDLQSAALHQFAAEFTQPKKSLFNRVIDGVNRLPRPLLAFGTIALFVAAMVDPVWFAARMQGISLVPEPLWWLLGAIVSFYFGARHQLKGQEFQRSIAETYARIPTVMGQLDRLEPTESKPEAAQSAPPVSIDPADADANAALDAWRAERAAR